MPLCVVALAVVVGAAVLGGVVLIPSAPAIAAASDASVVCRFDDPRLDEISGMAPSRRHPGILWLLNDSGGGPYLYAVDDTTCRTRARVRLRGAPARDYEGLASGTDARGRDVLWVGDIGDNRDSWPEVRVIAVPEPAALRDGASLRATTYRFTYPDRPRNAETLLADPSGPRLWVVTKALLDGAIWALPRLSTGEVATARRIGDVGGLMTDGAVAPDGSRTVIRDYVWAWVYDGLPSRASFARDPVRISLPNQPQGEALAWSADGTALLLASEADDRLLRLPLPREAWTRTAQERGTPGATPPPAAEADAPQHDGTGAGPVTIGAAVLLGLAAVGAFLLGRRLRT